MLLTKATKKDREKQRKNKQERVSINSEKMQHIRETEGKKHPQKTENKQNGQKNPSWSQQCFFPPLGKEEDS